jgi:hypothetical protein
MYYWVKAYSYKRRLKSGIVKNIDVRGQWRRKPSAIGRGSKPVKRTVFAGADEQPKYDKRDSASNHGYGESTEPNDWSPGEGWTEHRGSMDLRSAFGDVQDERVVGVFVSHSGGVNNGTKVDVRCGADIPFTLENLTAYLDSPEFALHRGARLIWLATEKNEPYLYAADQNGWSVWSNTSAIALNS